jgi:Nitrile hydratase, alpha chain
MAENAPDFAKIIAKAWRDPSFKAELIANPAAALKAEGIDVPAGMTVTVVENTDKLFHLVLPPVPSDELSDEALDAVAGGKYNFSSLYCSRGVVLIL